MKGCVVVATTGRGPLRRALGSVVAQSHKQWVCLIAQVGGDSDTKDAIEFFEDRRLIYRAGFPTLAAAQAAGMRYAREHAEFWVPLRSQDQFQPYKLEFDVAALRSHQAIYGPFLVTRAEHKETVGLGNLPCSPLVGEQMYRGYPVISWVNVAVQSDVIDEKMIDPRITEYCAALVNARIYRKTPWIWRGEVGRKLFVNPRPIDFPLIWDGHLSVDAVAVDDSTPEQTPTEQADYLMSCRIIYEDHMRESTPDEDRLDYAPH